MRLSGDAGASRVQDRSGTDPSPDTPRPYSHFSLRPNELNWSVQRGISRVLAEGGFRRPFSRTLAVVGRRCRLTAAGSHIDITVLCWFWAEPTHFRHEQRGEASTEGEEAAHAGATCSASRG